MKEKSRLNIIFLGNFPYPSGMAGTKRVQNAIDGIRNCEPNALIRVIVLRQSGDVNCLDGCHGGVPYETIGANMFRVKAVMMAPYIAMRAKKVVRQAFRSEMSNILYVYGPPTFDNHALIHYAKKVGFKIIFDIVEDDETAFCISHNFWHRVNVYYSCYATKKIIEISDGIIVISSWLYNKFSSLAKNKIPILVNPVSVNIGRFNHIFSHNDQVKLIYSGSFGFKDGVSILLDAFEILFYRYKNIQLILTGKGSQESLNLLFSRIKNSVYADRIFYKGFLNDYDYFNVLNNVDICCMTRIDIPYANAGFPFKLGEYLATGKPVIATKVSDVENYLIDRQSAMLVSPGNCEEIVSAVDFLLQNPEKSCSIGKEGYDVANKYFNYLNQGEALVKFMKNL